MNTVILDVCTADEAFTDFSVAWKAGGVQEARISFTSLETLWNVLNAKRFEILRALCGAGPLAIREVARRVHRDVKAVHADVTALIAAGLINRTPQGRASGLVVTGVISEIGSGLNGHRKQLMCILRTPDIKNIVVEHRDRLVRFGFEYLGAALAAQGRRIVVADTSEIKDDIVRDLHEVIVSMCARLYGKRAAKNRAATAIKAITP